jgi:signal transduction histidine kinase
VPSIAHTDQPDARFRGRDLLRTVAEGTAGAVGDEFLRCLVRHVLRLADDELGAAQAELRGLARGLHPVALSERGLRSALESLTAGCEMPVTLDVDAQELPQQIELAAYFIVSESLTNANKYADADTVWIRVAPVADELLVEIVDDGSGGADPASGTGLRGLADRIEALGGRLEIDSAPGAGTRVSAHLPLPTPG